MLNRSVHACFILALAASFVLLPSPGFCFREKPDEVIEDSCTEGSTKILITYDTKHGATAIVAEMIFDSLCSRNFYVDLVFVENLDPATIPDYDAVVVGSPIYIGKWLPGIKRLLRKHHGTIAEVPTAFFVTCTYIAEDTPERQIHGRELYIDPVLEEYPDIEPIDTGLLAGEFRYAELFPLERFFMKLAGFEEGDFMDDAKIQAWAEELGDLLK